MATLRLLPAALILALLAGCDSLPTRSSPVADSGNEVVAGQAPPSGPAANDNLNAVTWMQTSVEYRLIAGQTWRSALVQLDKAIKTPGWDALTRDERANPAAGLPPAIIVDVDETMLDNSPYQR